MGLLTDTDLLRLIYSQRPSSEVTDDKIVIYPFDEDFLTPVGYDLRVGSPYATSNQTKRKKISEGESLVIGPGSTALITTLEYIGMPKNRMVSALIESKVTKVSKGLSHISTTVDPDWKGNLLIAVHNHSKNGIEMKYGESFCTVVFFQNVSRATKDCDKPPGRPDGFLDNIEENDRVNKFLGDFEKSVVRERNRRWFWIGFPPVLMISISGAAYIFFGNDIKFSVATILGIAISQWVYGIKK